MNSDWFLVISDWFLVIGKKSGCFLSLVFLFLSHVTVAQSIVVEVPVIDSLPGGVYHYVDFEDVEKTSFPYLFRYTAGYQTIQVTSNDGENFEGIVFNYIYGKTKVINRRKSVSVNNYYYSIDSIPDELATSFADILREYDVFSFPEESEFKEWNKRTYLHCSNFILNGKTPDTILRLRYTCPSLAGNYVEFAKTVESLRDSIHKSFQLDHLYDSLLWRNLEPGCFYRRGIMSRYKMTSKQIENWEKGKPYREQLKSVSDTINHLLEEHLNSVMTNQEIKELTCYGGIDIKFSKTGRVKSCSDRYHDNIFDSLFDFDWHRCKRKMKKALKGFRVDEIDVKYDFKRNIGEHDGKLWVRDDMIY